MTGGARGKVGDLTGGSSYLVQSTAWGLGALRGSQEPDGYAPDARNFARQGKYRSTRSRGRDWTHFPEAAFYLRQERPLNSWRSGSVPSLLLVSPVYAAARRFCTAVHTLPAHSHPPIYACECVALCRAAGPREYAAATALGSFSQTFRRNRWGCVPGSWAGLWFQLCGVRWHDDEREGVGDLGPFSTPKLSFTVCQYLMKFGLLLREFCCVV